jgi:hypothetical protein
MVVSRLLRSSVYGGFSSAVYGGVSSSVSVVVVCVWQISCLLCMAGSRLLYTMVARLVFDRRAMGWGRWCA